MLMFEALIIFIAVESWHNNGVHLSELAIQKVVGNLSYHPSSTLVSHIAT